MTENREKIMQAMTAAGIASAIYYPIPLHCQDVFATEYQRVSLPVSELTSASCFSLPIFPEMTEVQVRKAVGVIREAL
jgi:dTDP-4-amino-4,6-dideoxygalactose transaminase